MIHHKFLPPRLLLLIIYKAHQSFFILKFDNGLQPRYNNHTVKITLIKTMDEDKITQKLLEHDEKLERIEENMAGKKDLNEIFNTLDKLFGLAEKKDQELTLGAFKIKQLNDKVEEHDRDIQQIKPLVGLT